RRPSLGPGFVTIGRPALWTDHPPGCLVGAADSRLLGFVRVHRLRHLGGVPGPALLVWPLPVALLLAGAVRRLAARLVRVAAGLVARLADLLAGALDPVDARRLPRDLLLLPRRLLQGVLGRPAQLHRRRAAQELLGRTLRPPAHPEHPPVFPLH